MTSSDCESLQASYLLVCLYNTSFWINCIDIFILGHRDSQDLNLSSSQYGENDYRQQVVAVGTPLPTSSVPAGMQQGPVMLTSKNLQSMRALLSLAHCHGSILGTSWHLVLTTLQHLVWILGNCILTSMNMLGHLQSE